MENHCRHRGAACTAVGWALVLQGSGAGASGSRIRLSRIVGGKNEAAAKEPQMRTHCSWRHTNLFFSKFIKTTVTSQTLSLWQGKIMRATTLRELSTKDSGDRIHAGFQLLPRDVGFGLLSLIADIWNEWTARQWCCAQKWKCIRRGRQAPLCGYFYPVYTLFLWVT